MAKKTEKNVNKEIEKNLFAAPENKIEEEVKMEENKVEEVVVEENQAPVENEMEMELDGGEMEMELDSEEIQNDMEELVAEKVKKEEKENKEQKSKRGPKPGGKKEETPEGEKKPAEKKEKALNLNDQNIIQREIKKGRLAAPQARIEKTEAGDYVMKLADGIIFPQDAKNSIKEVGRIAKMNDGKYVITNMASESLKMDKFKAKHENGEEVEHEWVRVELHKPGREKDVVELFTVSAAKDYLKIQDAKDKKKEDEAKKKAEKAAKEKAEKEAADKKEEATA
jgi:colicin import membrane protein